VSGVAFFVRLEAQSRKKVGELFRTIAASGVLARVMSRRVRYQVLVLDVKPFRELVARLPSGHHPRSLLRLPWART